MRTGRQLTIILATVLLGLGLAASPAQAATTKFTSCDKMHKVYKYGVAKSTKDADWQQRHGFYRPAVKPAVYRDSYKSLDRDKDGTMCEVQK